MSTVWNSERKKRASSLRKANLRGWTSVTKVHGDQRNLKDKSSGKKRVGRIVHSINNFK